uniref:Carbonic anhydrase n=1 Tax=Leptobrachium leishanense TaxID=445787 RepID=A0A8C5QFM3_9ANUR
MSVLSTCPFYRILQCAVLILTASQHMSESASSWTYLGNGGQENWKEVFPDCGGTAQSPINIQTANVSYDESLPPIQPIGYSNPGTDYFTLRNNGHTVVLSLSSSMHLRGLPYNFTAAQLHLHWGSTSLPIGSEHRIDGEFYPAEMHIVHYNSEKYTDINDAKNMPDGLAVLGIFLEAMPSSAADNPAYGKFFKYLENVSYAGQTVAIPAFSVHSLLPDHLDQYFQYKGSLTTPPCHQSVTWTVFHEKVQISASQLDKLQTVIYSSRSVDVPVLLQNNVREPQPLNQRTVYSSFHVAHAESFSKGQIFAIALGTILGLVAILGIVFFVVRTYSKKNRMDVEGKTSEAATKPPSGPAEQVEVKSFQA